MRNDLIFFKIISCLQKMFIFLKIYLKNNWLGLSNNIGMSNFFFGAGVQDNFNTGNPFKD